MIACKKCGEVKGKPEFYNHPRSSTGVDSTCKNCRREEVRKNRAEKADYYRDYDKKRFREDPRVKQRIKRYAKSDAGKKAGNRAKRKYIEKNAIKRGVHVITGNAIRYGILTRMPCEVCGEREAHAHHDDYAKPLDVRWLCPKHHREWHDENGEGKNAH